VLLTIHGDLYRCAIYLPGAPRETFILTHNQARRGYTAQEGEDRLKHHEIGRLMTRIAATGALTCGVAAFTVGAGPAYAAGTTRYVGASVGSDTSCASPGYTTVQAAVNAASPGDTVYLCGTTPYKEQVIITKSITLTGGTGATIAAPSPWVASADPLPPQFTSDGLLAPQAIVFAWGKGVHVTISGLTIAGPLPGNGGCASEEFGILVIGGASARISHDAVTNIADANSQLYGCQYGIGIGIGHRYWPTPGYSANKLEDFTGSATITHTTVSGYQKDGIDIDGPGSWARVSGNTITGTGPASAFGKIIAPNGIEVARGASAQIAGNTVSGNQYSGLAGAGSAAVGVLIYGGCGSPLTKHVVVTENRLVNNDVGVWLGNYDPSCSVASSTSSGDVVTRNRISSSAVTNISSFSASPLCGYQAGVEDLGNRDVIAFNGISGTGYLNHPVCTVAQPYVTSNVDTTGSIDPIVFLNF
jgi:hypothetical protein